MSSFAQAYYEATHKRYLCLGVVTDGMVIPSLSCYEVHKFIVSKTLLYNNYENKEI